MVNICELLTPALACGASVNVVNWDKPKMLTGLRVEDGGKSQCLPVIGGIGVEPVVKVRETR
jgi:hypothetical protein